jgi:peptidoglycan hydrolase CwlO-like protein
MTKLPSFFLKHYSMRTIPKRVIAFVAAVAVVASAFTVSGDFIFAQVDEQTISSRRAQLERELAELEAQIDAQRELLETKQRERVSLERDVAILDAKIEKAKLSIRARDISIQKLSSEIGEKEGVISALDEKIAREKESLAQLIRKTNEVDSYSLVEIMLGNKNLSEFFVDLDAFVTIKGALNESFVVIERTKSTTQSEKNSLEEKRAEQMELRTIQELEKRRIEEQEREKHRILEISRGVEKIYQELLKEKEKSAAAIRSELFTLRGSAAIPFGKALEYAKIASRKTGVRPAFLLGVIAEESNLGENVGTGNWRTDMHPTRDRPIFKDITSKLGLDPDLMPVSKKPWYGWGGAMGPAQFIPSTWILYEKKIAKLTKHNPPNPWDPFDALMAAAILLADNGAARGGYANERLAALRYFAGWKNAEKRAYAFYGDDVMELAAKYQRQIDILEAS